MNINFDLGDDQIQWLDMQIGGLYELMNMTNRIYSYPEISDSYRKKGLALGEFFFSLLEKERFKQIEELETRQVIITNARYSIAFFEGVHNNHVINEKQLMLLEQMLTIANDPFYIELLEDYDWIYHRFRTLQYYAMTVENHNAAGFTGEQMEIINVIDKTCVTEHEKDLLFDIHQNILSYAFGMPNSNILTGMLEYLYAINDVLLTLKEAILDPEYIIRDDKHQDTGFVVKRIAGGEGKSIFVILKICTDTEGGTLANSIISGWRISDKRLQSYIRNKTVLYKRK